MPVVPATRKAEAGESLEPRKQRLHLAFLFGQGCLQGLVELKHGLQCLGNLGWGRGGVRSKLSLQLPRIRLPTFSEGRYKESLFWAGHSGSVSHSR
ncbi:hypothetical protein AAY473_026021, partial [Plecturocebus cupreus]